MLCDLEVSFWIYNHLVFLFLYKKEITQEDFGCYLPKIIDFASLVYKNNLQMFYLVLTVKKQLQELRATGQEAS